jgi:thiol:disulfide interchange protein DsbC
MKFSALIASFGIATLAALPALAQDIDKPRADMPKADMPKVDTPKADASGPNKQDVEHLKSELKKRIPDATVDSVRRIPFAGLYEVTVGGEIFYTDAKAEYLVAGSIIDLRTKENITEARMRQVNAIKWDQLPLDRAIKIVRGNGSRKIALFEDPNCGYCKRLHRDLQGVNDLTMYVFLYPILSPDSAEKSKAIWCSADRGQIWLDHMVKEAPITGDSKCATPIDQNLAFGQSKRIQGTPTIIFENGDRVPGAIPLADLEKKLAEIKVAAAAH